MNKKDFVEEVAKRCMITPYVVDEIYNVSAGLVIEKLIKGEKVEVPNLGKFEVRKMNSKNFTFSNGDVCTYPGFVISGTIKNRVRNGYKYEKTL